MSDTPRTDVASADAHGMPIGSGSYHYVKTEFARQLERELAIELERVNNYRDKWQRNEQRIKLLEEALGKIEAAMKLPASNHRLMQIAGPARQVINIVKQAKEAKP